MNHDSKKKETKTKQNTCIPTDNLTHAVTSFKNLTVDSKGIKIKYIQFL